VINHYVQISQKALFVNIHLQMWQVV